MQPTRVKWSADALREVEHARTALFVHVGVAVASEPRKVHSRWLAVCATHVQAAREEMI